ncbi:MAG TPA: DUF3667 domain-containing protein [Chitinophaga sp.]|uniref:DUF3667 domain-containing protein n=1 Tax=Chitinophaga sp. TaxID=1869181 RepID=UPI002CD5254E|nr:DUF3667 domain-containing protein [Chitinophaga sp.]HVI48480.1 DUF3667 domain-containing protein [Chitinophaga sp.]
MKTQPLREDKHCLNCGTEVPERYCTHCGQENTVVHETFGHLVKHFTADIFHYDSQFLATLKYLLFKPGFLTKEYMTGRRVRYVNPIKLYVFVSFVFFLGVFSIPGMGSHEEAPKHAAAASHGSGSTMEKLKSADPEGYTDLKKEKDAWFRSDSTDYASLTQYDSIQQQLPDSLKDSGIKRTSLRRLLHLQDKYGSSDVQEVMTEVFHHNAAKLMFLLLPLFALLMKLMHSRKRWLYADHGIFAIHFHSFLFIILLLGVILDKLLPVENIISWAVFIGLVYLVIALRNVYQQAWWKAILKAWVLTIGYFTASVIVIVFYFIFLFSFIM